MKLKNLLCGYNAFGAFADIMTTGTDTTRQLDNLEMVTGKTTTRCWCCTFWRGFLTATLLLLSVLAFYLILAYQL